MKPIPVQSQIHPEQLNNQPVEFTIPTAQGQVVGLGRFAAHRNSNGFDYIDLIHIEQVSEVDRLMRYHLSQELVNLIQARDTTPRFMLAARAS